LCRPIAGAACEAGFDFVWRFADERDVEHGRRRLAAARAKARMPRRAESPGDFCFHAKDGGLLTAKRAADFIRNIFGTPSVADFFLMPTDCILKTARCCDHQSAFAGNGEPSGVFCR
jgi:hypothetical protein